MQAWNYLSNRTGSIDWAGLEFVVALLGIKDVESLVQRLLIIKTHRPQKPGAQE